MDSPETNKKIVAFSSTSDSPAVQESPFFNYLCTLSPIKPVKAASHAAQGFPELNIPTPPPVFTSPRLNPQAETNFLKRSKYSQSSNAKLSIEHEDRGYTFAAGSDVPEQSIGQLMVGLVPCTQKACDTKESLQVQPCSPSGFVDEYLSDPVEVDIVNLSDPTDSHLNQIDDAPETLQIGCVRSEESIVKVDNNDVEFKKNMDIGSDMQTEEKTEEVLQGESLAVAEPGKMGDGERRSTEYPDLISKKVNGIDLSNSSLEPVSGEQNVPHVETQSAVSGLDGKRDNDTRAHSGIVTGEHAGAPSHESVENKIANLELMPEAGQHQRGTLRRCLQFDASAARKKSISSNRGVSNPANINRCSTVAATTTDLKLLESSKLDVATSSNNCGANSSQPMASELSVCPAKTQETNVDKFDRSIRNCGKSFIKSPLPSGIGLHLNSIVNSAAMGCSRSLSINPIENDRPTIQREKSPSVVNLHLSEEPKSSSLPLIVVGKFSAKNYSDRQEIQSIVAENSSTSQFSYENADKFQELNQLSPDNKRKRTYEDEGCKRCNCRRSKCLKLYCECFAAGIYCAEPCACQGCFNKPEYEDMVLGTRQQIETRNPLAFAPKIVRRVTDSPANSGEDNNKVTPSSARHKRGCNCKKSMCLKKYCECYQSGVGCSSGCRCEGCKNAYGVKEAGGKVFTIYFASQTPRVVGQYVAVSKNFMPEALKCASIGYKCLVVDFLARKLYKDGYGEISGMVSRKVDGEGWEDLSDGKLVMETRSSSLPEHPPHNLTPLTPSFQSSNHGKDVPKSRLPYRCLPSPESDTKPLSSYAQSPSSPRNFSIHDKRTKAGEGNFDIVFDQEVEFSATGRMDQFSPRWDRLENICNLTPLPHAPSEAKGISSPSNTDSTNVSRFQLQGSVRFSGSLRWRSSPITPMPRLGGSKLRQESDSDIGYDILEDDTPDILKDTHTPIKAVKATSPNQKRVSPPHGHLHSLRSSASPGLKSGRKFVLQSISSFPSLTPYSDPKDSSSNK